MKRFKSLFMLGVLAMGLGLTSCSSDDPLSSSTAAEKGNTYVAVSLSMPANGSTRALPDDYNYIGEWAGKDDIKTVDIYLVDAIKATVTSSHFTVGTADTDAYKVSQSTDDGSKTVVLTPTTAIQTTVGAKEVYVVVNATSYITTALASTDASAFDQAYHTAALELANSGTSTSVATSASKIAEAESGTDSNSQDAIAMTNTSDVTIDVKPNVTSDNALASTNPQNRASVQVQRAVARVMVTTAPDSYQVKSSTGTVLGTVSDIKWALAQGENSLFVQQNSGYTTPYSAWVPASTGGDADYINKAGGKYDYSGLFENPASAPETISGTTVPTLSDYKALDEAGNNKDAVLKSLGLDDNAVNGKFILPTTHKYADAPATTSAYTGGYRKGNTAYVLVRAKFTPDPSAYADGGTPNTNKDGTFFLGANGKYYTTAANAVNPKTGGVAGQTVAKYVGGKVLYYAWLNPDNVATPYNSPVLRNNIYHIHITGFKTIGTNWNPLYPENPDTTNPTNPDPKPQADPTDPNYPKEPTNPIDPNDPLTTPETWMSVDVTVLPWQVHSYGVDLGI
jgi:hypothetical protein